MSFLRLIYWSSLIGGWSAFVGWLVAELAFGRRIAEEYRLGILMATLVAVPIGAGISAAAAYGNLHWSALLKRMLLGGVGGLIGGLVGSFIGMFVFDLDLFQRVPSITFIGRI